MLSAGAHINDSVRGQERNQMFGNADWTYTRTSAAMGNAKSFMQIEMTNINAELSRTTESDLGVHVRSIHVNLAAVGVNDFGKVFDRFLEYSVGGWIGNH